MSGDTEFWARGRRHLLKYGGEFVDFVPVRAEGAFLYDAAGRRVLDFTSGQMSAVLGHSHPEIVATVRDGIGRLDHLFSELKAHAAAENCTPAQLALAWLLSRAPDGCRDVSRVSIQVQQLLDLEKAQRIVPARHEEVRHINVERDIVDGYRVLSQWCGWALVRADSPVEEDGFELLVPRYDGRSILEISQEAVAGSGQVFRAILYRMTVYHRPARPTFTGDVLI